MRTNDVDEEDDDPAEDAEVSSNAIIHLKELQQHPGWVILLSWVEAQIRMRTDAVMLKADLGTQEIFMKGEVTAFRTFRNVADSIIADREYDKKVAEDARSQSDA